MLTGYKTVVAIVLLLCNYIVSELTKIEESVFTWWWEEFASYAFNAQYQEQYGLFRLC